MGDRHGRCPEALYARNQVDEALCSARMLEGTVIKVYIVFATLDHSIVHPPSSIKDTTKSIVFCSFRIKNFLLRVLILFLHLS